MNATFMSWLTPGAAATALIASATILTPTSLPFASAMRPLPRSVGLIRAQVSPLPDAATLPVRNPCTVLAASSPCERGPCSRFPLRILTLPGNFDIPPPTTSPPHPHYPPHDPLPTS